MKKIILKTIGGLVILALMLNTNIVRAASQADIEENNKKITESKEDLESVQAEKTETQKQIDSLDDQITEYQTQIDDLETEISDLNTKIEETQTKLEQKQEDFSAQEDLLRQRLIASYEAGETTYLDVLLSSEGITDLISNYYLISEITTYDSELLQKIENEKKEIEEAKTTLETSKNELDTKKASKESVTVQLEASKTEKNKKVAQLSEDEKTLQARIDELTETNRTIDKQIKAAQAAIEAAKQQYQQSGGNGGSASPGSSVSSSGFIWPVPAAYATITTGLNYSSGAYHGAVDFGTGGIDGQPVYAVADGYVVLSTDLGESSYGNYIIIGHYNGLYTLYAHGQRGSRTVSTGQTVKQGQQIMRVGSTGNSSGPHLHFEVRTSPGTYSNRVSPYAYLP